jgi:hypothetical protein
MVVAVPATDDLSGEAKVIEKSTYTLPSAQVFPAENASDPGRFVVVVVSTPEAAIAVVQYLCICIPVM